MRRPVFSQTRARQHRWATTSSKSVWICSMENDRGKCLEHGIMNCRIARFDVFVHAPTHVYLCAPPNPAHHTLRVCCCPLSTRLVLQIDGAVLSYELSARGGCLLQGLVTCARTSFTPSHAHHFHCLIRSLHRPYKPGCVLLMSGVSFKSFVVKTCSKRGEQATPVQCKSEQWAAWEAIKKMFLQNRTLPSPGGDS